MDQSPPSSPQLRSQADVTRALRPILAAISDEQAHLVWQLGRLPGEGVSPLEHLIDTYEALATLSLRDAVYSATQVVLLHKTILVPALLRRMEAEREATR